MLEHDIKALSELAEDVMMEWLAVESPSDRRRQQALELLAEAWALLCNASHNLKQIE